MLKTEELLEKAETLFKKRTFINLKQLKSLLTEEQLKAANNARLFELKGIVLRRLAFGGYRDKQEVFLLQSIKAFTKAIQLDEVNAALYSGRGKSYSLLQNFDLAIKDHKTAIKKDPKNIKSYIARAETFAKMKNFKAAKKDFNKAIQLEPINPLTYRRRMMLWKRLRLKTNYMKDLKIVIEFDKEMTKREYRNYGDYCFLVKNYDLAFELYNKAINLDPNSLNRFSYSTGPDFRLVNIYNALDLIKQSKKMKIYKDCIPICESVEYIRDITNTRYLSGSVVHFTKLSVADILLSSDSSRFRYYHVSYMNDPEEGRILLELINKPIIKESFNRGEISEWNNFYIGSFLPESHADELVMWRTYGKDENENEAKGCSIVINREYFQKKDDESASKEEQKADKEIEEKEKNKDKDKNKETRSSDDFRPYKVIYYDKLRKMILGDDANEIKKEIKKLQTRLNTLILKYRKLEINNENKSVNQAIDRIVYYVLTELRYLFKSSDYAYENEERVIRYVQPTSDLVKIDDISPLPKRLYVEAKNPIRRFIKRIVLGPRVVYPDRWLYLKVKAIKGERKLDLIKSNCKFQ